MRNVFWFLVGGVIVLFFYPVVIILVMWIFGHDAATWVIDFGFKSSTQVMNWIGGYNG
jgi:hypothetical protein